MRTKTVTVLPYDGAWSAAFDEIAEKIGEALGDLLLGIEHVGSTAVAGMSAKPCIDLDAVIREGTLDAVIGKLADIGYIHEGDLGIKDREAFRYTGKPHLMAHHLYVCPRNSKELRRHMVFRDYLRSHPEAAARYSRVKEQAAARFPDDIDGYMAFKVPCVRALYEACGLE